MTARQPPREKGAKACTIGLYQSRDWYFCAYFSGSTERRCLSIFDRYNDESYEVATHWGRFRLDRSSYEDYLAGKLWITWAPGNRGRETTGNQPAAALLPDVSEDAIRLRDLASRNGIYAALQTAFPGRCVAVPYKPRMRDNSIFELMLSVRSSNGLMRANADTFGRLHDLMAQEGGLRSVRNLGAKSEAEIRRCFFDACFLSLTPGEQAVYCQSIIDGNQEGE